MNAFKQSEAASLANLYPSKPGRKLKRLNALTLAHLVRLLMDGESTLEELREETGLHSVTISNYIKALRKQKACFIKEWAPNTRGIAVCAIYKLGKYKTDAKRPAMSPTERSQRKRDNDKVKREQMRALRALAAVQHSFTP